MQSGGNASGGQYRTAYGIAQEFITYTLNVASVGNYTLKLWAASMENPTAGMQVNGGAVQGLAIGNTGSWSNFVERTLTVSLNAGNNTIRLQGRGRRLGGRQRSVGAVSQPRQRDGDGTVPPQSG